MLFLVNLDSVLAINSNSTKSFFPMACAMWLCVWKRQWKMWTITVILGIENCVQMSKRKCESTTMHKTLKNSTWCMRSVETLSLYSLEFFELHDNLNLSTKTRKISYLAREEFDWHREAVRRKILSLAVLHRQNRNNIPIFVVFVFASEKKCQKNAINWLGMKPESEDVQK